MIKTKNNEEQFKQHLHWNTNYLLILFYNDFLMTHRLFHFCHLPSTFRVGSPVCPTRPPAAAFRSHQEKSDKSAFVFYFT